MRAGFALAERVGGPEPSLGLERGRPLLRPPMQRNDIGLWQDAEPFAEVAQCAVALRGWRGG